MKQLPRDFWLLCASTLLFTLSFNLIVPELNSFLEDMGEGKEKWAWLVPWTISAMLLRPVSGKISDVVGRKFVIYFGIIASMVVAFFYPYALFLTFFFWLRFFHGFCVGFQPTGASALAADLIPQRIRGEGMGFFSISIAMGFGIGQALSQPIKMAFGMHGLFYSVAVFGAFALLLMLPVAETQTRKADFKWSDVIPRPSELIEPSVFAPTLVIFLITVCTGFYMLVIPDMSLDLGLTNKGMFWFTHMVSSLVVRFLAGRLSDRIGRRRTTVIGVAAFTLATCLMINVSNVYVFLFCGFLYGVGTGIYSPTIMAWATDLSNPKYKGKGLGTMWMGLEFGVMVGAFAGEALYNNNVHHLPGIFGMMAVILVLIVVYLLTLGRKVPLKYIGKETPGAEAGRG